MDAMPIKRAARAQARSGSVNTPFRQRVWI